MRLAYNLRPACQITTFSCILALAMLVGSYLGILIFHALFNNPDAWSLANFHLSILASYRMRRQTILTTADAPFRRSLRSNRLLPVHFTIVIDSHRPSSALSPHTLLSPSQQCAIEAALRVCEVAHIWIVRSESGPHDHGESRLSRSDLASWAMWRSSLLAAGESARHAGVGSLGLLVVRLHRFHPSSAVGAWLVSKGAPLHFNATHWAARGWAAYPAIVSDLVRLDVLDRPLSGRDRPLSGRDGAGEAASTQADGSESSGGVYLDTDVVALHRDLLRLPDGIALQVPANELAMPFVESAFLAGHGLSLKRLYESCNGAVLVSRSASAVLPRVIARVALRSWESWNHSGEWGILGPRAVTQAWAAHRGELGSDFRLYSGETFGFVTCGRRGPGAAADMNEGCAAFSTSELPIDDGQADDDDWLAYVGRRLAQHGIKSLLPAATHASCLERGHKCTSALCVEREPPPSLAGEAEAVAPDPSARDPRMRPLGRSLRTRLAESRCPATWRTHGPPPCERRRAQPKLQPKGPPSAEASSRATPTSQPRLQQRLNQTLAAAYDGPWAWPHGIAWRSRRVNVSRLGANGGAAQASTRGRDPLG